MKKKVCDLAKELGVDSKVVLDALAEIGSGVTHHLAQIEDDVQEDVAKLIGAKSEEKATPESSRVKFWARARTLKIARTGGSICFSKHILVVPVDDERVSVMRSILSGKSVSPNEEIWEVVDKPHEDEAKRLSFSDMLTDLIFTGLNKEPARSGIEAVRNMYTDEELGKLGFDAWREPRRLILRTVEKKSLIRH